MIVPSAIGRWDDILVVQCRYRCCTHSIHCPSATGSVVVGSSEQGYHPRPESETRIAEQLAKLASHLDKWSSRVVCRTFLQRIKQMLTVSRIPEKYWSDVFIHVVTDVAQSQWITDNILNASPVLTWQQACDKFTSHFELSDHTVTLRREYRACKQLKTETVQGYADRFLDLIHQLSIEADHPSTRDQFVEISMNTFIVNILSIWSTSDCCRMIPSMRLTSWIRSSRCVFSWM